MRAFERITRFTPGDAICEVTTSTTKWFFARTSSAATRKSVQAACVLLRPCHSHRPHRPRAHPEKPPSRRSCPLTPSRARRPTPSIPRTSRRPCAEKRKHLKPLDALRAARTTPTRTPRPPSPPCDPLAVSATLCAPLPVAVSGQPPSSTSVGFQSSGSPFPRPPLPPVTIPSQPPRSYVSPLRARSAPSHRVITSRRYLSRPSYLPPARDAPLPAVCLLPLPARPSCPRPPLPTSNLSHSPPVPHRPDTREKASQQRTSEPSLRVRLRRTRTKQKGERLRSPPRTTRVSVEPQRVTRASPCRPPSPSPFRPTVSRQRPP